MSILTPLVSKVKKNTQFVFQSAYEDWNFTFDPQSPKKFRFSKYALLNIPAIVNTNGQKNTIQFQNIEGAFLNGLSTDSPPPAADITDFSQSLQNYLLNLETLIINDENYNSNLDTTVAERVFFKWLKEIGAIRFRAATLDESPVIERFCELDEDENYSRVVKFIGDIDMEGNSKYKSNAYKEVYIYVPTEAGATPTILFKSVQDENYAPARAYVGSSEYIEGRDSTSDPTSQGLTTIAFFDLDVSTGLDYNVLDGELWFNYIANLGPNAYFTDEDFLSVEIDTIERTNPLNSDVVTYKRSRLDGISVEFEKQNYKFFTDNQQLSTWADFNNTPTSDSFEFNCVALYYDIYDTNGVIYATNLFGFVILNDFENISDGGARIITFDKVKPNAITYDQGIGYSLKLNLKIGYPTNSLPVIDVSVNDYNTFSMLLFTETMQKLNLMMKNFEDVTLQNLYLKQRNDELEAYILNSTNALSLLGEINSIKQLLTGVTPNDETQKMLITTNQKLQQILQGQTSVQVDLLLNPIGKDGIQADIDGNKLTIKSTKGAYNNYVDFDNININPNNSTTLANIFKLGKLDTLISIGKNKSLSNDVWIFVDDSENNWQNLQTLKIAIDNINFNGYQLIFATDSKPMVANEKFGQIIARISPTKPTYEIVCINPKLLQFKVI